MNWEMIVLPALIGAFVAMFFNLVSKIGEQTIAKHFDRNSRRETERDGDLNEFCKIVFEIRDLSVTYWMRHSDDSEKMIISASIVGRLTFANSIIEDLYGSKSAFCREMYILFNRFDKSCTSGGFKEASRDNDSERCRNVEIAAYRLVHKANYFRRRL